MRPVRELLAFGAVLTAWALVWVNWGGLPASLPTHFGISGAPDAWGSKSTVLLLPSLALVLYGLVTLISFFPQIFNYPVTVTAENRPRLEAITLSMLGWIKAEMSCLFAYLTWNTIRIAQGRSSGLGWEFLPVFLVVLGLTIGMGIVQCRRAA